MKTINENVAIYAGVNWWTAISVRLIGGRMRIITGILIGLLPYRMSGMMDRVHRK